MKKHIQRIKDKTTSIVRQRKDIENESSKVPVITNSTVSEHRDQVLSEARKFIVPLRHSRKKIVTISISIAIFLIVSFISVTSYMLYKSQSTSRFTYKVTQLIPYPIARIKTDFISYEDYLFELRRFMHYSSSQQKINFQSDEGKLLLADFKTKALQKVIDAAYIKQLAADQSVTVTDAEIDDEIGALRAQSRTTDKVFEDVLKEYWGWTLNDLKRSVKGELLEKKVVYALDKSAQSKAEAVVTQLKQGKDFGAVVAEYSDDTATKTTGGVIDESITRTDKNVHPKVLQAIFNLKPGQVSDPINSGRTIEIIKLVSIDGDKAKIARIQINLRTTEETLSEIKQQKPVKKYIHL